MIDSSLSQQPTAKLLHYWRKRAYLRKRAREVIQCWRDLDRTREVTDISTLVDYAFAHCIRPDQIRAELIEVMKVVGSLRPATALEIGTHSGGSLFLLCRLAASEATIVSLDLPGGRFGGGYAAVKGPLYKRFAGKRQSLHLVREDSHKPETLDRLKTILGTAPLDYLFIDGDHSYGGVKQDFEMYSPLVRKRGLVVLDDIAGTGVGWGCGVPKFWKEIKGCYTHREIIADPKQEGHGAGLLWM
jgi:cephalosporin hydroxylase